MLAEFIDRPISGQFPEKHFGSIEPFAKWVKFTDNNYQEWAGSFTKGWDGNPTLIINLENERNAFIVVGGIGYFVDIIARKLTNDIEISGIKTVIADITNRRIIFSCGYNLQCLDFEGKIFTLFDDYFFDEIEFIKISDNKLYIRYWYYQRDENPFTFELDLKTYEVKDSFL